MEAGKMTKSAAPKYALIGISLIALLLRLWGVGFGLPHRYHIDEPPYVLAALRIAAGDLYIVYPYNSPNLFQFMLAGLYGLWYVIGWILGVFSSPGDLAALYQRDPTGFYLLARGLVAFLSTGTVVLLYLLGRFLSDRLTGLLAACFLALAFSHARDAHYAVTDTLITSLVVASLLGTVLYARSRREGYLVLAGLTGGAAVGLKYLPAPILLPPLLGIFVHLENSETRGTGRGPLAGVLVLGVSSLVGFLLAFPAPLLRSDLFRVQWYQVWMQASGPLGRIQVDPAPAPLYYPKTLVWGLGAPMLASAALGLILELSKRRLTGYLYVVVFCIAYFAGICLVQTAFPRYALPLVPFLVLFAAKAIVQVVLLIRRHASAPLAAIAGVSLCLVVGVVPATKLVRHNVLLTRTDTRTLARDWIEAHVPPGARIAVQWYGPALSRADDPEPGSRHTYDVASIDPFDVRRETYDLNTYRKDGVSYLVVNSWHESFRHQDPTQDRARQRFYRQLESEARLAATIQPGVPGKQIPFVFEQIYGPYTSLWRILRPGPEIRVYDLSSGMTVESME
jgi:4-amino-4-deoxy-L-arabinose transferase-like glycosyltransferase